MPSHFSTPVIALALSAVSLSPIWGQNDPEAPTGTVAFFNRSTCPSGWNVATKATGKLILGVTQGTFSGDDNGEPALSNKENRSHDHCYQTTVHIPDKSISAISATANPEGAKQGDYPVSGKTDEASTDLPFTQLVVCEKG